MPPVNVINANEQASKILRIPVPDFSIPVPDFSIPVPDFSIPVPDLSIPVPDLSIPVPDFSIPVPFFSIIQRDIVLLLIFRLRPNRGQFHLPSTVGQAAKHQPERSLSNLEPPINHSLSSSGSWSLHWYQ